MCNSSIKNCSQFLRSGINLTTMGERHQFRADWHTYEEGIFFVTICCKEKNCYFGSIKDGVMHYSVIGQEIENRIIRLPELHDYCTLDNHVVMPNHIHLVIGISRRDLTTSDETKKIGCLKPTREGKECFNNHHNSALSIVINHLKGHISKFAKAKDIAFEWQPRYHEHIIFDNIAYRNIMNYIDNNVENWDRDRMNKNATNPFTTNEILSRDAPRRVHG